MNTEQVPTSKLVYSNSAEPAQTVTSKSLCIVYEEIHFCLWGHHKELLFFKSPHQEFLSKLRVRPRWATVKLRGRMSLKIFKVRPYKPDPTQCFPLESTPTHYSFHACALFSMCLCLCMSVQKQKGQKKMPRWVIKSQDILTLTALNLLTGRHSVGLIRSSSCDYCVMGHVICNLEGVMVIGEWGMGWC